jgi:membrane dipeptidase
MPNLTAAMVHAGWSTRKIEKVIGGNWMRVFKEVWGA